MFFKVLLIGLLTGMSPGPDFFIVTQNSLGFGKRIGIASAVGIAAALSVHATYSILGLTVIMRNYRLIFTGIQLLGAAYLLFLGVTSIIGTLHNSRSQSDATVDCATATKTRREGFVNGFLCNILNPKAYIFFLSIFSQFMSPGTALWMEWVYAGEVVVVIGLWFCLVAVVIATDYFRALYRKSRHWIERIFGTILILFAIKITKAVFTS